MKMRLAVLAAAGLALGGCYGPYGQPDPLASGLVGAGVGAVAGAAIASSARPSYYYAPPAYYAPAPRYYYGPPRAYGYGYGYRRW
ncbi:hypothetical protein ACE7GA_19230 [Roseomonas sp. CCTCC AB2023176]|uniref:hypothetical protein n=1 Tax=Roseomonas sp. CCTCC AB2023176 TaxID=3342640 RepID=UPI0035DBFF71